MRRVENAAGIPERDGGLAGAVDLDVSAVIDAGDAFVVRVVFHPAGNVGRAVVGVVRADDFQLLFATDGKRRLLRVDFQRRTLPYLWLMAEGFPPRSIRR